MAVRIDGNNDLINAADGSLTVEGISVNVVGVSTATGGFKVGTAYTVFPNGNVATAGVVTTTKLQVNSATNTAAEFRGGGGAGFISIKDGDDGTQAFIGVDAGKLKFQTSGSSYSDKVVIATDGKVGIGSEIPTAALNVSDSSPVCVLNREVDSVNQLNFKTLGIQRGSIGASSGSCLQVHDSSSIEKFRILQNGKVGINTNNPSHLLDISGNGVAFPSAAGSPLLRLRDSSGTATLSIDSAAGSSSVIQFGDTSAASQGTILYNNNSDYFQFNTAGTGEKLRLDSSGNLGIGTNVFPVNGTNVKVSDGTIARFALHKTGSNERNFEIGNGGTFLNVYDVTADAQRLRINSSGNLKLGTATADRDLGGLSVQRLHIEGTDGGSSAIGLVNNQNSTGQAAVYFSKSRGTSVGSNTILQDGDPMGSLVFCGSDGNDMISIGAQITASVDGTPGSNDMPGRLVFSTTADGAATATEGMRLDSSQRLLIGTTSAVGGIAHHLQVVESDGGKLCLARDDTTVSNGANLGEIAAYGNDNNGNYQESSKIEFQAGLNHGNNDKPGRLVFSVTADGGSSATERLRITHDGKLDMFAGGATSFRIDPASTAGKAIFTADGDSNFGSSGYDFRIDGTDSNALMMVIRRGTNPFVGIGRDTQQSAERLSVDRAGQVAFFTMSMNANHSNLQMLSAYATSSTNGTQISFLDNTGTQRGRIINDNSTTQYVTSSDYRLKENEVLISDGITRLKTLKPYRFNWKQKPGVTVDGFFAHEVTSAVPEAIAGEKDAVVTQAMVDAGTHDVSKLGDPEYQMIDQSKLVPLLTAALQEEISKREALEARVAALEGS